MLRLAVQHVNRLRPRFLLISGDLINAFPTSEHEAVGARQVASFKEALHELNPSIPVLLQPGNHDIGQRPTTADIERYRARFGDDYYSFWVGGVMYISLNSQYYRDADAVLPLAQAQDEWASAAFREAEERGAHHVVVLSHVPPFIADEDEQVAIRAAARSPTSPPPLLSSPLLSSPLLSSSPPPLPLPPWVRGQKNLSFF